MDQTIVIRVTNQKVLRLLKELEDLKLLEVIKKEKRTSKKKLSDKYKGVFTEEDANDFDKHVQTMRDEWKNS